jgi:hypothetical protein
LWIADIEIRLYKKSQFSGVGLVKLQACADLCPAARVQRIAPNPRLTNTPFYVETITVLAGIMARQQWERQFSERPGFCGSSCTTAKFDPILAAGN